MSELTLIGALKKWCEEQPDKMLHTYLNESGKVVDSCTYAQLEQRSGALARALLSKEKGGLGLARGDRVLLVYPPSLEFIIAFWACLRACVIAVPVFPPDPRRLKKDLYMFASIQESSQSTVALTSNDYNFVKKMADIKRVFSSDASQWPELTWFISDKIDLKSAAVKTPMDLPEPDVGNIAFLQYTSGSTSEPKGVMITHANLAHNITIFTGALKAKQQTVVASWLPQYHDMGLIGSYLGACHCGGAGVYTSPFSFIRSPPFWMEMVTKYGGTHLQAPNFAFGLCARKYNDQVAAGKGKDLSLGSIQHMINAAEPVDIEAIREFSSTFKKHGLDTSTMFPTYGLAEHTVYVCSNGSQVLTIDKVALETEQKVVEVDASHPEKKVIVGCGVPKENDRVDLRIVKPDTCELCAEDEVGEIWINSPSKAAGYWNRNKQTQEEFFAKISNLDTAARYLRTGDLGFLHNDELFICSRIKDLVIIRGRNHYPQDIERTIESDTNLRPGCSAAFSYDLPVVGEQLVIVAELRDPKSVDFAQTVKDMRNKVAQTHGVELHTAVLLKPKTVPKTTSGKIARKWCKKAFEDGTLKVAYKDEKGSNADPMDGEAQGGAPSTAMVTAPRATAAVDVVDIENLLSRLQDDVAQLMECDPDGVDLNTPLIELGMDSMTITQLRGVIENNYSVEVDETVLFGEETTLKVLEGVVRGGGTPPGASGNLDMSVASQSGAQEVDNFIIEKDPPPTKSCWASCCGS
jgi:acyl-CoA synthetase (AMP-forming)/AMP-acid ligase II/acyl carrier protein